MSGTAPAYISSLRSFELFHPGPLKCFSLLCLWSCVFEAGGLWGSLWLENLEQSSSGGQHTRSTFIWFLWKPYSTRLSCLLNTGQWDLGLKWWYMNTSKIYKSLKGMVLMANKFGTNTKKYFSMQSVADLWNSQLQEVIESNAVGGFHKELVWQTAA